MAASSSTSFNTQCFGLRGSIYDGKTVLDIWEPAIAVAILIFCVVFLLLAAGDFIYNRRFLKGERIRGTSMVSLSVYQREHRKDEGYRIKVYKSAAKKWVASLLRIAGLSLATYWLSVPRKEETEGLLLLGDPGTGKSQVLHQVMVEIARRKPSEALICYDPEGEFVKNHADEKNDRIFNPFDSRCPYWSPTLEVNYDNEITGAADRKMIAEAFFPYRRFGATHSDFFIDATRSIFGRILEVERDLTRIIEILTKEELIDKIVAGTEYAHLINPGAKGQRGGVLATLSEIGESLKLLPPREQCTNTLSLTEWAKRRKGWIFITSKQDTRDATRRLHAAMINILMKRLLAAEPEWATKNPCWLVIDEVHALGHLSALPTVIVEGRKHGLKICAATQNKAQLEEQYGRNTATMLAAFHTKAFFRCNEPESARWVSDLIGDEEKERPRMGTTASVQRYGRDSINYTTTTELRPVVSKEEIMSLANLHGYWKHEKLVVLFRIKPLIFRNTVQSFVERKSPPTVLRVADQVQVTLPHENGKEERETATEPLDDFDISF